MYGRGVSRSGCSSAAGAKNRTRVRYSSGAFATSAGRRKGWVFLRVGCRLPLVVWGAGAERENRRKRDRTERELRLVSW